MTRRLMHVTAPHFCAGAVWEKRDGRWHCVRAAPIIGWMAGADAGWVHDWLRLKGYVWEWDHIED